jgi:hypothetical protein
MFNLWGLKSLLTRENEEVFSHEQLVLAEQAIEIFKHIISAVEMIMETSSDRNSISQMRMLRGRILYVMEVIEHCRRVTYDVQSSRKSGFTARPLMPSFPKAKPLPPVDMAIMSVDPEIIKLISEELERLRSMRVFTKLLSVSESIDRFLPTLEKELEIIARSK